MSGECSAAHADNTHGLNPIDNLGGLKSNLAADCGRAVNGLIPLVTLDSYCDTGLAIAVGINKILNFLNLARNRRVDVGRDKAAGLSNELTDLDNITSFDDRNGGSANVLCDWDLNFCRHRELTDRAASRKLHIIRVDAAYFKCLQHFDISLCVRVLWT